MMSPFSQSKVLPSITERPLPCTTWNTLEPATRLGLSFSPLRIICTRHDMVGSTGPPVCAWVYSSEMPSCGLESWLRSSCSASAVCSQEQSISGEKRGRSLVQVGVSLPCPYKAFEPFTGLPCDAFWSLCISKNIAFSDLV